MICKSVPLFVASDLSHESLTVAHSFFANLAHTRWGLDPALHTPSFVKSRSLLLFTSMCSASALFQPFGAALSTRLANHCRVLVQKVVANRCRSTEIVLALMLSIPWMPPGEHWADDQSSIYLSLALTIAMDLSLDKMIQPSPSANLDWSKATRRDSISARTALDIEGFREIESNSILGKRLLRTRERTWLALFVLERG